MGQPLGAAASWGCWRRSPPPGPQGAGGISCHRVASSGNQGNRFNKLYSGGLHTKGSPGSRVCAHFRWDFTVVLSLCSELPLCATEEACFVWARDLVCHLWRAIFQADGSEIQQATPAARDRDAFLASKRGASFACKAVSVSSPTLTNYVSLSFTQLPAAPFQYPHL